MSEVSPEMPEDPWVNQDMLPLARTAHDMYVAFIAAGFNEPQAIQIITGVVTAALMSAVPQSEDGK